MVAPKDRSRSKKRVSRRTPGGKTKVHYKKKKKKSPSCSRCKKTTTLGVTKIYGGSLCPACTEASVRYETQFTAKHLLEEYSDLDLARDLTIEKFLPKGWYKNVVAGTPKKKRKTKSPKKKAETKKKTTTQKKTKKKPKENKT